MPSYGETQRPAGVKKHNSPRNDSVKTMKRNIKGFKIVPPVYKGNAVLNANR
jgi:hypothetical protein